MNLESVKPGASGRQPHRPASVHAPVAHHFLFVLGLGLAALNHVRAAETLARREWTVDGVVRAALVYAPPKGATGAVPVVFAFHGHGGTMHHAARTFAYHARWPEALVVYPQGLNTPGRLTDPEGRKPGWQHARGDQGDRDLKFFDAMLASLKRDYRVDEKRLYATGHSNGGAFTYLLWATRGDSFAAFAPSAAVFPLSSSAEERAGLRSRVLSPRLQPKPVLHVAGENDPLVKFAWQTLAMAALRRVNQCDTGQPWEQSCTLYPSKTGAPVVTFIHPGAHEFPADAPAVIVKFFQQHAKP
ncbi:MAG: prolyl oligopeptidase family serine peptidase [Verrucomicrobia bacterium]|nr:prolyl oligopeptidase family serine peptidase [Verrucomicrobiota bacterium]